MKISNDLYISSPTFITDFMENLLLSDFDFKNAGELYETVWYILEATNLVNKNHIHYLDFDVEFGENENDIRIVGNNIVTSLWFSNIYPDNPDDCYISGIYESDKYVYRYDASEKKLLIKRK